MCNQEFSHGLYCCWPCTIGAGLFYSPKNGFLLAATAFSSALVLIYSSNTRSLRCPKIPSPRRGNGFGVKQVNSVCQSAAPDAIDQENMSRVRGLILEVEAGLRHGVGLGVGFTSSLCTKKYFLFTLKAVKYQ